MNIRIGGAVLVGLLVIVAVVMLSRGITVRYDLTEFLPAPTEPDHALVHERLGAGPGSALMTVAIASADDDVDSLYDIQWAMVDALEGEPSILRVIAGPGEFESSTELPEPLWSARYLLTDQEWTVPALKNALADRISDLAVASSPELIEIISADPLLAIEQIMSAVLPVQAVDADSWLTEDGELLTVIETTEPGFEMATQQAAVDAIDAAFEAARGDNDSVSLHLSGPGAFGVALRGSIQREAKWRSMLASGALILILMIAYRRPLWVFLGAVPLAAGVVVGMAAVAIVFGEIHGVTIAFGFTLLGIAIDFPLHLFSHARGQGGVRASMDIRSTVLLGGGSTVIAYLAMAVGGSAGLAQLGVFTAAGVATAVAITLLVLPLMIKPGNPHVEPGVLTAPATLLRWWPQMVVLVAALVMVGWSADDGIWDDNLARLSPVPQADLVRDGQYRQVLGSPDLRYALVTSDPDREVSLRKAEALADWLQDRPEMDGFSTVASWLPSEESQRRRQNGLPDAVGLSRMLAEAREGTPFAQGAFSPFTQSVADTRSRELLVEADYVGTPFEPLIASQFYRANGQWVALASLYGLTDPQGLARQLPDGVRLMDFHQISQSLVAGYRQKTIYTLAVAALFIGLLLVWRSKRRSRALWVMATVVTAVAGSAAVSLSLFPGLNLYHLVALILVAGLSLDYALFASRDESAAGTRDSWHALTACAFSTSIAFALLGASTIPLLRSLGIAVTAGCVIAYAVSWLATRNRYGNG